MYPIIRPNPRTAMAVLIAAFVLLGGMKGVAAQTAGPDMDFTLPLPKAASARAYLGIPDENPFSVSRIRADVLIVQVFSMYCPVCQREAGDVNKMYDGLKNLSPKGPVVKMIGIGAGNTEFEVEFYQKKYDVEFPLFADRKFEIHQHVGEVRTPHFMVLKKPEDGSGFRTVYKFTGEVADPASFLQTLLNRAGYKEVP